MNNPIRALCLIAVAAATSMAAGDPFVGTWKLDVARSTYKNTQVPKDATVNAVLEGGKRILTITGEFEDGSPIHLKVIEPLRSGDLEIQGNPPGQTRFL